MTAPVSLPSAEHLGLYLPAVLLCIAAPGPDMLLSLARGLGQGRVAATVSALGTGCGIAGHSLLVGFGLTAVLRTSVVAFTAVKLVGAGYLVWLGVRAVRDRSLVRLATGPADAAPVALPRVFTAGLLSNLFNPKVAIFVLAFIPQFVDAGAGGDVLRSQILGLGAVFAVLTVAAYSALGAAASAVQWALAARPRWVVRLNVGCGAVLVAAGVGVLALRAE